MSEWVTVLRHVKSARRVRGLARSRPRRAGAQDVRRAELLRIIRDAKRKAARLRKWYPHAYCWAAATFPKLERKHG